MSGLKWLCVSLFIATVIGGGIWGILKLEVSENLDATIPGKEAFEEIGIWLDQNKKTVVFSIDIDPTTNNIHQISALADSLINILISETDNSMGSLTYQSDIDPDKFLDFFYNHIALYLDESDYKKIDSLIQPEIIESTLAENKIKLLSPEGLGIKPWLIKDPLHLLGFALNKIKKLNNTDDIIDNEGLFISKDGRKLFIQGQLNFNTSSTKLNRKLASQLENISENWNTQFEQNQLSYFGLFLIADANANQIKKDVRITASLAILFIISLLIYYYRKFIILVSFLLPGLFGVLFAIGSICLIQGNISGLALGASAIIIGIVADYSFHYFSHFRQNLDALKTRNEILLPLTASGLTTIIAFLSLLFADSKALHDFGLFTSLSLAGTLIFVLTVLPYILKPFEKTLNFSKTEGLDKLLDKIVINDGRPNKKLIWGIGLATVILLFFATNIKFEDDFNKLNFSTETLKKSERELQNLNPDIEKRINMLVTDASSETALENNFELKKELDKLMNEGYIRETNSLAIFLIPINVQKKRIEIWNAYWDNRANATVNNLNIAAKDSGFKSVAFKPFYDLIQIPSQPEDLFPFVRNSQILSQLLIEKDHHTSLITSTICNKTDESVIRARLKNIDGISVVDGKSIIAMLISSVRADFNYLLLFASLAVFIAMLLIYGRIELTLISFLPMVISWIWILGISSLLNIKFNFINIIIATFIFGLGDDFSIFITDGLQKKYKSGQKVIRDYKTGILLSAITTIVGTGVLIFAKHPALKSIAFISVIGISTIVFISFFVQPVLFRFFITSRVEKGRPPVTLTGIFLTITGFAVFISGSLLCSVLIIIVRLIPLLSTQKKKYVTHLLLQKFSGFQMDFLFVIKKGYFGFENLNFNKPSIIISNHTSFLDILSILRLHPKIVMVVNKWVFSSPLFGSAIRFADFIPAFTSIDENLETLKKLISQGYSIAVFPEGSRSPDGQIRRFHKGAFYMSEKLKIDITPIMIHGINYVQPKHDLHLKNGLADMTVLPRISFDDNNFGIGYKERTKRISAYFKKEFQLHLEHENTVNHIFTPLLGNYIYKGPIIEWYFRFKWKFEKTNYEAYNQLIGPGAKTIYDMGCGYGFLSYFLLLRNDKRMILGYDYDSEKIAIAQNAYLKSENINFKKRDIKDVMPKNANAILLADVLHYLSTEGQLKVLDNCKKGLKDDGIILIRDGISNQMKKHKWTSKSEKWSTSILKFNKTTGPLNFFDQSFINSWAQENDFEVQIISKSEKSSNVLFVLSKN